MALPGHFGKGPFHIETFANGNVITTLLSDVFTGAEKLIIEGGRRFVLRGPWVAMPQEGTSFDVRSNGSGSAA